MRVLRLICLLAGLLLFAPIAYADEVRVKDLGRFLGWRDNALVGYGIVTGLSGSGDSPRSAVTRQTLGNVLSRLGINIPPDQLQSRNVAAVIVTATLPPAANVGDRIDATVASVGDARSLAGGTLLMTPLMGPDRQPYALAQGPLVVGGYHFQDSLNLRQKNYPTSGQIPGGATVEAPVGAVLVSPDGDLTFILKDPDFTTAGRIADGLNQALGFGRARVRGADAVLIRTDGAAASALVARIETITVRPDLAARVVINERSGTVVAGGGVLISSVVVAQGDIKVAISVDRQASQPTVFGGFAPGVRSLLVTNTRLEVDDSRNDTVIRLPNTTVADLVQALSRARVSTRNMIAIMQAIRAAGALHAEIIVQ
jgi:flagellar P-ring protein precursor FlgI